MKQFLFFLALSTAAFGQTAGNSADSVPSPSDETPAPGGGSSVVKLDKFIVSDHLDQSRQDLVPSLGASSFVIDKSQIALMPLGDSASFNQVLLRAPGVAQDSAAAGGVHVRGEHGNLQYRINDILLPEGISGFGTEIDPRFVSNMQLVTGSLPAQYGFNTAGIVDIHTESGNANGGGEASLFGGSFHTLRGAFDTFGGEGPATYFVNGSYDHNDLGIENPVGTRHAIHDTTAQSKAFAYLSFILDATSRLSVIGSVSDSDYQLPDTPGLAPGTAPDGNPWLPGTFDSARLNENQREQNYYGVLAYQKTAGDLSYQLAAFGRHSGVHYTPDPVGDLFFNGVASDVDRTVSAGGLQFDGRDAVGGNHTLRGGLMFLGQDLQSATTTTVFPVDADGNPTGSQFPIVANGTQRATFFGVYLQDEWKPLQPLTINYGARFDTFSSTFDREDQLSPRLNLIWRITDTTTFHAGYARYFTPPPLENVPTSTVAAFAGTSNAAASTQNDPVKAERANYFDAGVSQNLNNGWQLGLDGYYKTARNQLDDGLFGQTLILSAFNYRYGRIYGLEFTSSYTHDNFSTYLNLAHAKAQGKDWSSAQFQFDPGDLAYVQNHWIFLDHDQTLSASFGAAYTWDRPGGGTSLFVDSIYGSGLRTDGVDALGQKIPNGGKLPGYGTVSVGIEQTIKVGPRAAWKLRLDVQNLTDAVYELRNGQGVGVNAPQYGQRRGLFGTVSYSY
ncbi:MAG: TonB-dependent receptor [Opitutales bacterium]